MLVQLNEINFELNNNINLIAMELLDILNAKLNFKYNQ